MIKYNYFHIIQYAFVSVRENKKMATRHFLPVAPSDESLQLLQQQQKNELFRKTNKYSKCF